MEKGKSISSVGSSIESLTLSARNLSLNNGECSSSLGSSNPSSFLSRKTQELGSAIQETKFDNSNSVPSPLYTEPISVPSPLYTEPIWGFDNASIRNRGIPLNSNAQLSVPFFYFGGSTNPTPQESEENYGNGSQNSTAGMQNQESFNSDVASGDNGRILGFNFMEVAMTPVGSRSLQDILMLRKPFITSKILEQVIKAAGDRKPVLRHLMVDLYGWHVCSKLIDSCDEEQLGAIVETIATNQDVFELLCKNLHASKLIKKLIKLLKKSPYVYRLINSLYLSFESLMLDRIGSYVLTYCLDSLAAVQNESLYGAILHFALALAEHEIGCITLNNFIDRIQGLHRRKLLNLIAENAVHLSQDPSGNHVMQKVLGLENPILNERIGNSLRGHYARLSVQKWGSHVVEKCLKSSAMSCAVEDLLGSNKIKQLAKDQFGNYVIQSALKVTSRLDLSLHAKLLRSLQPHLQDLRSRYGRNVLNLIVNAYCYRRMI